MFDKEKAIRASSKRLSKASDYFTGTTLEIMRLMSDGLTRTMSLEIIEKAWQTLETREICL